MQPKLVRKGTAAAVAETAAAALAEHEAARRVDPGMAAAAFDKALGPDPLAEGRAKGTSRAPGLLPRLATGCSKAIVTAFDPRTREYTGFGADCWLLLGSAMGPRCACRRVACVGRGGRGADCRGGRGVFVPSPHRVHLPCCLLQGLWKEKGPRVGLLVALEECHGAGVRVST